MVSDTDPLDSYLVLSGSGSEPSTDGRLTMREIYGLKLNSELVILSACRTGRGKVTGDGVIGLTRAFFYAGTPSVIASLWDVGDEPTRRLATAFYASWLRQGSKARALRDAQLELLHDLRRGRVRVSTKAGDFVLPEHPTLWAAFLLFGQP